MVQFDTPINATDASFEQTVLRASLPVVAVFWSQRDVPRQQLNALLQETNQKYANEIQIVKLDVADAAQTQAQYHADTLPQFLFFRQGKLVARAKGMPSAEALRPWIEYLLERGPMPVTKKPSEVKASASGDHPLTATDADFEQGVLGASVPVLVDFWAAWCGPCRMVAPVIEQLAQEFAGRAVVAKLDVDHNPITAQRYGVQSIPTLIFFRNGQEVDRAMGAQPAHVLRQKLEALL